VGKDGQVSVTTADQAESQVLGQITVTTFVNNTGLEPIGENLFAETSASGAPMQGIAGTDGVGTINQCCLEVSNVNVTEELVNLITAQRVYEMNSKVLHTVDQMMGNLVQTL
jgi:flagellar basal-body rod protein FlgG